MKNVGNSSDGHSQEVPKISGHPCTGRMGALRGHLCDSTAFLLVLVFIQFYKNNFSFSSYLVMILILLLVLIIVFCLTFDMVINREHSLVLLQCIDCYNAIQQDSGIRSQVQSLEQHSM